MKITTLTLLFGAGVLGVEGAWDLYRDVVCNYKKSDVAIWNNCKVEGKDPYTDKDCGFACARAGRKEGDKFVHGSDWNGGQSCRLVCYFR
ncbi:hypothetical protein IWW34DRAFT_776282 [Fusarium oxysporum f. sp. albedinis]|nr:hypothetical protein IWW34DRAFT_776282 [Fusarium oxysporum f. sp. albedinis]KAJ0127963.1 Uncharacterized protein HZ326_28934 [Fusarium oxysporum f. sp. albedinis]